MKLKKQVWIAALCLLSAMAMAFSAHTHHVQAAKHIASKNPASLAQPAVYLARSALRGAMMLDSAPSRVTVTPQGNANPDLPGVEQFTLTPPNLAQGITKTTVSVRFPELQAERLASQIPFNLADQNVILQRSTNDPRIFSTQINLDWNKFAQEQQERKELAGKGRQIPVFEGHRFMRMDNIEFVDPGRIHSALQSHQPIQFTSKVLEGIGLNIDPQTELLIVNPSVITDPAYTFDPCNPEQGQAGTPMGDWTFGGLMQGLVGQGASQQQAEVLAQGLFSLFMNNQTVNGFPISARNVQAVDSFLSEWGTDGQNGLPNIANAHFQLNAIVNRIDIGQGSSTSAGELRFVFGATSGCSAGETADLFNVIFEYNIPITSCQGRLTWAQDWQNLETIFQNQCGGQFGQTSCQPFDAALHTMTQSIAGPGDNNLVNLRSNEAQFVENGLENDHWEMRAFSLTCGGGPSSAFCQVPLQETPSGDPSGATGTVNFGMNSSGQTCNGNCNNDLLSTFINTTIIDFPGTYSVPKTFQGVNFAGGSAFNTGPIPADGLAFWVGGLAEGPVPRSEFSANTCNGCHGRETEVAFQQIVNTTRSAGGPALSAFLVGCDNGGVLTQPCPTLCSLTQNPACLESVQDPVVSTQTNSFGDIARRETYLATVLEGCSGDGVLQPLVQHRVNFVH